MSVGEFEKLLVDEVRNQAEGEAEVQLKTIRKNNNVQLRAIIIKRDGCTMAPTIYLEQLYQEYEKGIPVRHLARLVLHQCETAMEKQPDSTDFFLDYESVRKHLYCKLINAEKNKELLQEIPYQEWEDLAIVCYYRVDPGWIKDATILIRNEHMLRWRVSKEDLIKDAMRNTISTQKPSFHRLSTVLDDLFGVSPDETEAVPLYILTNGTQKQGALCILYPGEARSVSEKLHSNYYIIPSSVHECLILPDEGHYPAVELNAMIHEINKSHVDPQEILADHAYYYHNGKIDNYSGL